jgi:tetratricopeptide (TPR) repeat protein
LAQEKPRTGRKPVLIRADPDEIEKVEEEIIHHDPVQAKKSVEIGDFYLKRKNYQAAEKRYREAIEYNLKWDESYKKLIKLFEKQKDYSSAVEICQQFVKTNPTSNKKKDFEKLEAKLEKKIPNK